MYGHFSNLIKFFDAILFNLLPCNHKIKICYVKKINDFK